MDVEKRRGFIPVAVQLLAGGNPMAACPCNKATAVMTLRPLLLLWLFEA